MSEKKPIASFTDEDISEQFFSRGLDAKFRDLDEALCYLPMEILIDGIAAALAGNAQEAEHFFAQIASSAAMNLAFIRSAQFKKENT